MSRKKVIESWVERGSGAIFHECLLECEHIVGWFTYKVPKTMTCYLCEEEKEQVKNEQPHPGQ